MIKKINRKIPIQQTQKNSKTGKNLKNQHNTKTGKNLKTQKNYKTGKNEGNSCCGGANTNRNGKLFEKITDPVKFLIENGFKKNKINNNKYGYYLSHKNLIYVCQYGFRTYFKKRYGIKTLRIPDESFIIKNGKNIIINIFEKKYQKVNGSVETKLWASPSLKREYELYFTDKLSSYFENITITYTLCLSDYFKKRFESENEKYRLLSKILSEANIKFYYNDYIFQLYNDLNKLISMLN